MEKINAELEITPYQFARSKYLDGEPEEHLQAKYRIGFVGQQHNYEVEYEYPVRVANHKGYDDVRFDIDVFLKSKVCPDTDQIAVQVDGEIHRHSDIQKGRTQQRDDTLSTYCIEHGIRYVVFNHPNVTDDLRFSAARGGYSDMQIARLLGLSGCM